MGGQLGSAGWVWPWVWGLVKLAPQGRREMVIWEETSFVNCRDLCSLDKGIRTGERKRNATYRHGGRLRAAAGDAEWFNLDGQ